MIFQLTPREIELVQQARRADQQESHSSCLGVQNPNPRVPQNLRSILYDIANNRGVDTNRIGFHPKVSLYGDGGITMTTEVDEGHPRQTMIVTDARTEVLKDIILSNDPTVLNYRIIKSHHRLTFDIISQHPDTRYRGEDLGPYFRHTAGNGYEIFSRSRMDIHTERIWLLGAKDNKRSATLPYSDNEKRDRCADEYHWALSEWIELWKLGKLKSWK